MTLSKRAMVWTAVGAVAVAVLLLAGCNGGKQTRPDEGYETSKSPEGQENLPMLLVQPFFAKHLADNENSGLKGRFVFVLSKHVSKYRVLSDEEIASFMQFAENRTLMGSCLEGECLTQLAEKLNAKIIVQVLISQVGERTVLQANIIDGPAAGVLKRISRELDTDQIEKVLDEMDPLAVKTAAEL